MKLFWKEHIEEISIGGNVVGMLWKDRKPYRAEISVEELVNLECTHQKTQILINKVRMCVQGRTKHIKDPSFEKYIIQSIEVK